MDRKGLAILVLAVVILMLLFTPKASRFGTPAPIGGFNIGNTLPSVRGGGYGHSGSAMNKLDGHGYPIEGNGPSSDEVSSASLIPVRLFRPRILASSAQTRFCRARTTWTPAARLATPRLLAAFCAMPTGSSAPSQSTPAPQSASLTSARFPPTPCAPSLRFHPSISKKTARQARLSILYKINRNGL